MSLIPRLAALERRRPPRGAPADDGPFIAKVQLGRLDDDEARAWLDEHVGGEVRRVCPAHPFAVVLDGETHPGPSRCAACGGRNVVAAPA